MKAFSSPSKGMKEHGLQVLFFLVIKKAACVDAERFYKG